MSSCKISKIKNKGYKKIIHCELEFNDHNDLAMKGLIRELRNLQINHGHEIPYCWANDLADLIEGK